jgi:flagellar basal body P-ring protein FlgI
VPSTVLVGTKKDLAAMRKDYTEAERIADALNCPYIETSAKADLSSNNVDKAFELAII